MYLLTTVVFGFIVFVILYARYMNVSGNISKRRIQLDNLRDDVYFRVKRLKAGTEQINKETEEAVEMLESLKETLKNIGGEEDDS
ncbi:hypothetical protein [Maridesulfovibrio hydrothermalis]|uniref:Uncharacterized protein n=1 Tax=Maridesulfovibrio hydrothermalis AM13 = DSM 14728 TaxID=1121451 RepID=L0R8Y7_9BACT|nr:hypothetical protein [Maridesulfovibrio hydrothermalis]CCO22687.1 conserved protein of unknown function [Maridesulfovibrio hydrothermalis AM13 = DSM 14728]